MVLPDGVFYHPKQKQLIGMDQLAIIRIESQHPGNDGYKIKDRRFKTAIAPYLHGDWQGFHDRYKLSPARIFYENGEAQKSEIIYSGAEHGGNPKLPNITVVPNLYTEEAIDRIRPWTVFGCTMGHYHTDNALDYIQEVYEFQSYGMLILEREGAGVELWIAKDGDKVAVPSKCHMTLYNLGDEDHPLITLDFANPSHNASDKELVSTNGPILLAYYDDLEVVFMLNRTYTNIVTGRAGADALNEQERQVRLRRRGQSNLGRFLYEQLTQNPDVIAKFIRMGLAIKRAAPDAVLETQTYDKSMRLYFSLPLKESAKEGTEVYQYFFVDAARTGPGTAQGKGIAAVVSELAREKERLIKVRAIKSPMTIVVEGAGDWTEKTYRKLFIEKVERDRVSLNIFYADDTRWRSRPNWAVDGAANGLRPWEVYLDKADSEDFRKYQALRSHADVVFIATPDSTHSEIASLWLEDTSLIFIEKPFDSHPGNVEELLDKLQESPGKVVLGLDHYQFYALPIYEMISDIEEHLGSALARVTFYLTEARPIENGRTRSLQYGLSLDLLPHLFALLAYFGDVSTIDDIRILEAGTYDPLITAEQDGSDRKDISEKFVNETYSRVQFAFQDYSENGYHVPCVAIVGKGFSSEVKYLEVTGSNGNAIRADFNPSGPDTHSHYPWDSLFFLLNPDTQLDSDQKVLDVPDPYLPGRVLRILEPEKFCKRLERSKYEKLIDDLIKGTNVALACTLSIGEAPQIVKALDRTWLAIQNSRPWVKYKLSDPVRTEQDAST